MVWIRKMPLESIALDIVLTIAAFLVPSTSIFYRHILITAFWVVAPLQVSALYCAFSGGNPFDKNNGRNLPGRRKTAVVLNLIRAVGSFLWLFFIANAIDIQTGGYPY